MLTLVDTGCDDRIQHIFENVRIGLTRHFRAVHWRASHNGADSFLPIDSQNVLFAVRADGSRTAVKFSGLAGTIEAAVRDARNWFFDDYDNRAALILRRNALIVLHGESSRADLYIAAPDLTAHERIADIEALEAEYPNTFQIGSL